MSTRLSEKEDVIREICVGCQEKWCATTTVAEMDGATVGKQEVEDVDGRRGGRQML